MRNNPTIQKVQKAIRTLKGAIGAPGEGGAIVIVEKMDKLGFALLMLALGFLIGLVVGFLGGYHF